MILRACSRRYRKTAGPLRIVACAAVAAAISGAPAGAARAALDETPETVVFGDQGPLGGGTAHAWVRVDAAGRPTTFGVSFDPAALAGLPPTHAETALALPRLAGLPFVSAVIDWAPHGHPPGELYGVPHFDVHFYAIAENVRTAIVASGPAAEATPAPDLVPAEFAGGDTVPAMGRHYIARSAAEYRGGTFGATPIYGYWNGHLAFVEAMVALSYLQTHPAHSEELARPARVETAGAYPGRWSVAYDPTAQRYDIAFGKLVTLSP